MKKILLIGAVLGAVVLTLAATSLVYAQTQTPPTPDYPYGDYGQGRMGGRFGGLQAGLQASGDTGPLHEYMSVALADALGITPEKLEASRAAGETLVDIAEAQGFSLDKLAYLVANARAEALSQAVADGVISQEQADWMLSRMNQGWGNGFGPGSGACDGSGAHGFGRRSPGYSQP